MSLFVNSREGRKCRSVVNNPAIHKHELKFKDVDGFFTVNAFRAALQSCSECDNSLGDMYYRCRRVCGYPRYSICITCFDAKERASDGNSANSFQSGYADKYPGPSNKINGFHQTSSEYAISIIRNGFRPGTDGIAGILLNRLFKKTG